MYSSQLEKRGELMSFSEISQIITNVGYPIAMSLILLYIMRENDRKHDDEVNHLTEAINNNTLVMQQLISKLDPS